MEDLTTVKNYLRVDYDDDDGIIEDMIRSATSLVMDIARVDEEEELENVKNSKVAVLYAIGYLYEHREEADHHALAISLRNLLFAAHEGGF